MKLNTETLFTEAMNYACAKSDFDFSSALKSFHLWTGASPAGKIYSGYRRQVLAFEGLKDSLELAKKMRAEFQHLIVLGIGGSALGAKCAYNALKYQVKSAERRSLVVIDNLDPIRFEESLADLNLKNCAVAVITKSGGTLETMGQLAVLLERFKAEKLDFKKHLVAITDPQSGSMRAWVKRENIFSLSVPSDVGGRFSVFTPVGLFPLAFAGIDVEGFIKGAASQFSNEVVSLEEVLRVSQRLKALDDAGFCCHVVMPYASVLKEFGEWFVQLWGESLGKTREKGVATGPAPMAAVGATDQHSLLQLLVEGAPRFTTAFIEVREWPKVTMPTLPEEFKTLSFAFNKEFGTVLNAELKATEEVLVESRRPCYRITLDRLDSFNLGKLLGFYMDLTTASAVVYGINPYDQPGVELGKKLMPRILGA